MSQPEVTQIMPDNPDYIALSHEAKSFKNSILGRYMLDRAAQEAGAAAQDLCEVDPNNSIKIIELQNKTKRLRDLNKWLSEAISIGDAEFAEYQLKISEGE